MTAVVIAISVYVLMLLAISLWHNRKGAKGEEDFLIADRNLGPKMTAMSILASFIGGGTLMGNTNLVFTYGLPMLMFVSALPLGVLLIRLFADKLNQKAREEGWLTFSDMFNSIYGHEARTLVTVTQCASSILITALGLIGGAKMISLLTGISYDISVFLTAGVVASYLMVSGFSSVVKTDFIQGVFLIVLFAMFTGFVLVYPVESTSYADFGFKEISPAYSILFAVIALIYMFGDEGLYQRIYAARDTQAVKKSLDISFFLYVGFYIILMLAIFKLKAIDSSLIGDMAFLNGLISLVPASFHWAIAIAVLSVILSSIDTYIFSAIMNLNKLFIDKKTEVVNHHKLTRNMKISIPFIFASVIFVALYVESVLNTVYLTTGLISCNALVIILGLLKPKLNKWYAICPIVLNLIIIAIVIPFKGFFNGMVVIPFVSITLGILIAYIYSKIKKI